MYCIQVLNMESQVMASLSLKIYQSEWNSDSNKR